MNKIKNKRIVSSYRIKEDRLKRFIDICKNKEISHCVLVEVLVDKFLRNEIHLTIEDFKI